MEKTPKVDVLHERDDTNPLEYPREYFDAQVQFAVRWSQLSGEPLRESLRKRTVIARRLDDHLSDDTLGHILDVNDERSVTDGIFALYASQNSALYTPSGSHIGTHKFGFFGYDYLPDNALSGGRNTVKIHFLNSARGSVSGLAAEFADQRRSDIKRLVESAVALHPEIDEIIGGSWLYNLPPYLESFPPEFTTGMKQLVPAELAETYPDCVPHMSFRGNSLWGQFIDRRGWAAESRCLAFEGAVSQADSLADLYEAFPLKPLQPSANPQVFLDWDLAA